MALYGTIEVNGWTVGAWKAVRRDGLAPGWHEYAVVVTVHEAEVRGTVAHRYADGPVVLAAKALRLHVDSGAPGQHVGGPGACEGLGGRCGLPPRHKEDHLDVDDVSTEEPR